jgi:hypothetical protein
MDKQVVVINSQPTVVPVIQSIPATVTAVSSENVTVEKDTHKTVDVFNPAIGYGYGRNPNNPFTSDKDPGKPLSVIVEEGFGFVRFNFTMLKPDNFRYLEVFRASIDNVAMAQSVGFTESATFTDVISPTKGYFYWFRMVTFSNAYGEWYSQAGTYAEGGKQGLSFVSALNGLIGEAQFSQEFTDRLTALDTYISGLQSSTAALSTQIGTETSERESSILSVRSDFASLLTEELNNSRGEREVALSTETQARLDQYNALALTLDTLSARLDTEGAARTAAINTEAQTRISSFESVASQIAQLATQITDEQSARTAALASEQTARIEWDEAFTSQLDNLTAALTTNTTDLQAQLTNEVTARTTRTDSLAQEISDLLTTYQSDIADISAQVSQEASTRSSNHLALAQSVESLAAEFDTESSNTSAALAQEAQARSDADTALTNTVNTLSAQVTTNHDEVSAAITDEAIARVALDESIAGRLEEFNASMTLGWGQIGGEGKPEDGADVTANSQALSDTNARVTAAEGSISTQAESINSLSSGLEGVANLTAETALKTSIESINGLISGQAEQITKLEAKSSGINLLPAQFASFDYITKTPALYKNGNAGIDVNGSGGYGPDGSRTSIRLVNTANNAYVFLNDQSSMNNEFHNIPVESGKQYIASAYVKLVDVNSPLATSNIQIAVRHVDVANGYLGYKSQTLTVTPGVTERIFIKFTAFTNAAAAAMRIQSMANSGNGDVYLSFDRVMVEQVSEDQTEPSNWVPGNLNTSVVETMQVDLAKAMASYTMALDSNGFVTSLALTNDGSTSAFKVKSSNFSFYDDSGNLILGGGNKFNGTYIANATIPSAAIASLAASKVSASTLSAITANLGTCTAGIIKSSDGNFTINLDTKSMLMRKATSGQRTEYRDTGVKVYDTNNIARIELGAI